MLLKAFLCPLGSHNIFKSVIPLYRVFPAYKLSTISSTDIPIEKILKATSNRKFDTVQDAMFCSVIIQMISNNKTLNKGDINSIEKELQRMVSKSLRYMHELSVSEALLLSNRLLNLLRSKNLKISHELKMNFLKKINNNIEISLNKNCESMYFNKVLDYVKFLVNSKAPRVIITDLLIFMEEKASSDQQILDIVNVYLSLKSRNIFFWFQTIQIFIEKRIGLRIDELPLNSPLIDESILQLFLNFKLNLKWPFNCFPVWVFKLMEKLKQKHLNSKFEIASSKRINFLSTYVMVIKSAQNFSQCYFIKSQSLVFIVEYFLKICEFFDGSQMETMEKKIQPFFDLFFSLYLFFKNHSLFDNEAILFGMDQSMCNIFDHYYSKMPAMISKQSGKNKQKLIESLISYCLRYQNLLQIYQNRNVRCGTYLPKLFNKVKQIFIRQFSHQKQEGQSYSHYKLLPVLIRLSKEFEKVNISTGKYEINKILQKCQKYLQSLSVLDMRQIYSRRDIVDVISFVRISMLSVQLPISDKFATIYQQHQTDNFSLVTETLFWFNSKCNEVLGQQMLRLNRVLLGKFEKHLSQQSSSQNFIADLSSDHYKYQNMEEQLASNLIYMFKVRPLLIKSVDSKLYNFWFIQHPEIIVKTFSATPPKNTSYWVILISNLKYLRLITRQCAIDLMAQIMRVCHISSKKIEDVFLSIFTDKVIYSSLFEKVDQIAEFKYMWIVMLFNKIYLNFCLRNKQSNNQDMMIFRHESSNDKVSFHNSVQLMAIFSHDIKSPLELGSFKSQLTCRTINKIIHNSFQTFESHYNKRGEDTSILRRERQKSLSMLPIEQLIYLLTQHNFDEQAQWISYVNGAMFLGYIEHKYTTLQQYNLLLCLDKKNPQTKRAVNSLISRQMQLFGYTMQNADNNLLYESTLLKFYFYLLQPNQTQNYITQSFQILDNQNAITNSQIMDYWICKAIVLNTVDDRLISRMLKRLFLIPTELTYLQLSTIINTLITLFKKGRLLIYNQKNSAQWRQLKQWIERNILELVEPNPKRYLLDYFTLLFHQVINPIASIEDQMEQLITFQMNQDNIEIVHHLYTNKHYLSEKNFQDLRDMLQRCRCRALFLSYQNLPQNCYFRVGFLLVRLWAIAIRNDANHNSIEWFINHISTAFDTTGIIDFFSEQGNRKFIHLVIKRYRISQSKLGFKVESKLFEIIRKFAQIEQSQLQIEMTQKQKILSKDQMDSSWEEVNVTQKGLQMHKNGDNIMYFLEGSQVSAEQQIQMDYLKLLIGQQISVSIRKRDQTIKN